MELKRLVKRLLPIVLGMSLGMGAFTACDTEQQKPDSDDQSSVVTPVDPGTTDPSQKEDPVEDPGKDPEDEKEPDTPPAADPDEEPDNDPDNDPDKEPDKEPDKDDPPQRTKEEEDALIRENIINATYEKLQKTLGRKVVINKILGIDYKTEENKNYAYLLVDSTSNVLGNNVQFMRYELNTGFSREDMINNEFTITQIIAQTVFSMSLEHIDTSETTQQIYNKLQSDGVLQSKESPKLISTSNIGGGVDATLHCGVTDYSLHTMNNNELEYSQFFVKDDGGTKFRDNLINGTLNVEYRKVDEFYYEFSENAQVDIENGIYTAI